MIKKKNYRLTYPKSNNTLATSTFIMHRVKFASAFLECKHFTQLRTHEQDGTINKARSSRTRD